MEVKSTQNINWCFLEIIFLNTKISFQETEENVLQNRNLTVEKREH